MFFKIERELKKIPDFKKTSQNKANKQTTKT
jgi:hypothetical protein